MSNIDIDEAKAIIEALAKISRKKSGIRKLMLTYFWRLFLY